MYFMLFLFLFMYGTILIVNVLIIEFFKTQKQTFTNNLHVLIEGKCDTTLVLIFAFEKDKSFKTMSLTFCL